MAVDVQELTTTYGQEVRRARTEVLLHFREVIAEEIEAHPDHRDEILSAALAQLREHRANYRDAGNVAMEDIVLDAMDIITGWSAHAVRV